MPLNSLPSQVEFRVNMPKLPGALPGLGHLPAIFTDAPALIRRGHERLGPIFLIHLGPLFGWRPTCCGPEGFELLKSKAISNAYLAKLRPQFISERGLLALEGTAHQRLRGLMSATFAPRGLGHSGIAELSAASLTAMIDGWLCRGTVKVLPDTRRVALDIIFQLLQVPRSELDEWYKQYRRFALSTVPLPIIDRLVVKPALEWLDRKLRQLATDASARPADGSVLGTLAHAQDQNGEPLSLAELADNMRLLLFAGHDTSASAMAWAVLELARAPKLWDRLVAEVNRRPEVPLSAPACKELPLCEAIFRETVRLHPATPLLSRHTVQPLDIAGYRIPPGEMLVIPVIDFCLEPSTFPDPLRFHPDRFLERRGPPSPLELSAFGGGIHFCLGYHLAMLQGMQFVFLLAKKLSARALRPRLIAGTTPKAYHLPLSHPRPGTLVRFH